MRNIEPIDLLKRRYCIENGNIVEKENGDFFSKKVAETYLINKDYYTGRDLVKLREFDDEQIIKAAVKYCRNKYKELLSQNNNIINVLNKPLKNYEIISLNVYGGKIFLLKTEDLPEGEDKELYYNFDIANKVYEDLIDCKENPVNDIQEVQDLFYYEILKIQDEIVLLKEEDERKFNEDIKLYEAMENTPLYNEYASIFEEREELLIKNKELEKMIEEYNVRLKDLGIKLDIALDRIQVLQSPKTFFEKLKDLFKNDNKKYLTANKKN